MVMSKIWKPELVAFWFMVLSIPQSFNKHNHKVKPVNQKVGQPQGLAGSFDLFAIDHHILMLMAMKQSGLEEKPASEFCAILGDDNGVNTIIPDPDKIIEGTIVWLYQEVGWEIQVEKCLYTRHTDKVAIAEFAKVTVINGKVCSPTPARLFSRIGNITDPLYALTACIWMNTHEYNAGPLLKTILDEWYTYSDLAYDVARMFFYGDISRHLNSFRVHMSADNTFRWRVAFCYCIAKIRGTFLESILSKDERNKSILKEGERLNDVFDKTFGRDHRKWLLMMEDHENHKVAKLYRKNATILEAVNSLLDSEFAEIVAVGMNLTDEEKQTIILANDLLQQIRENPDNDYYQRRTIGRLLSYIQSFDRFQMKSVAKKAGSEVGYLSELISLYTELYGEDHPENAYNDAVRAS